MLRVIIVKVSLSRWLVYEFFNLFNKHPEGLLVRFKLVVVLGHFEIDLTKIHSNRMVCQTTHELGDKFVVQSICI